MGRGLRESGSTHHVSPDRDGLWPSRAWEYAIMAKKRAKAVDPGLKALLDGAEAAGDRPVEVVFTLRTPEDVPYLEANRVQEAVHQIVEDAQRASGKSMNDLHVMPLAQSFAVAAPAGVVRQILRSDSIDSAIANRQSEDLAIEPVASGSGKKSDDTPQRTKGKPKSKPK
jgi:hypothetical protein